MSRASSIGAGLALALLLVAAAACQVFFPTLEASPDAAAHEDGGAEAGAGDATGDAGDGSIASKDFSISVNPAYLPLAGGGSASVTVTVQRKPPFAGGVTVSFSPPPHVSGTTMAVIPPDSTTGTFTVTADASLPPGALGDFTVPVVGVDAAMTDFAQAPLTFHLSGRLATFTSGTTPFKVPASVSVIEVKAWGAGGGSGCNSGGVNGGGPGGSGGFVAAQVSVMPGETLDVVVGATSAGSCSNGVSGGGSGSAVLRGGTRLVIAGGGGGGGSGCSAVGGPGGGGGGVNGADAPMGACDALGGRGATQGADGASQPKGNAGSGGSGLHDGGNGGTDNKQACACPGSGGGGGASGGSDLVDAGVTLTANLTAQGPPPNTADPDYVPDAGAGAGPNFDGQNPEGKRGNDGLVVFLVP